QKATTTDGGSASADTTVTRDLNTVVVNEITGASLSDDIVTLPAGTYYCEILSPTFNISEAKANLYDNSTSSELIVGLSVHSTSLATVFSAVKGTFTLETETDFAIKQYTK